MAYSSKYGFIFARHLNPSVSVPAVIEVTLANSAGPLTVGDLVRYSSGYLVGCPITTAYLGVLAGFVTKNGENIFKTKSSLSGTKSGDDTYTASSSNVTVDMVRGEVVVDVEALFFAYNDTTLTQAYVGTWFNGKVNDGTYVDGLTGTGAAYSAGSYQFQLIELVTVGEDGTALTTAGLWRMGRNTIAINDAT